MFSNEDLDKTKRMLRRSLRLLACTAPEMGKALCYSPRGHAIIIRCKIFVSLQV